MKMVRSATAAMDDLDAVLSATPVAAGAVTASMARVDAACQACHAVYREEDAATRTFKLKPRPWSP
jgi:cytochrome c556